jgi:hypothetical protein
MFYDFVDLVIADRQVLDLAQPDDCFNLLVFIICLLFSRPPRGQRIYV